MAVQERAPAGERTQGEVDAALGDGVRDELLEEKEPRVARLALEAEHQRLVAEREQTRGLQADDGNVSLDEWGQRREGP